MVGDKQGAVVKPEQRVQSDGSRACSNTNHDMSCRQPTKLHLDPRHQALEAGHSLDGLVIGKCAYGGMPWLIGPSVGVGASCAQKCIAAMGKKRNGEYDDINSIPQFFDLRYGDERVQWGCSNFWEHERSHSVAWCTQAP